MYDDIRNLVPVFSDKDVPMYPYVGNVKQFIQNVDLSMHTGNPSN